MYRSLLAAAVAAATLAVSGCGSYRPAALSASPYGIAAARDAIGDRSLKERYTLSRDPAAFNYPAGADVPPARPASERWGVQNPSSPWLVTPLEREAERKSIARDLPHASVSPWGTAQGY